LDRQSELLEHPQGRIVLTSGARGFTLVELLVGVTIAAVLLALGAPALGTYLQNAKVASAANVYYGAVQTAKTEAIRRNTPVQFVLTSASGTPAALAASAVGDPNGRNWVVRAASGAGFTLIDAKGVNEGDSGVQVASTGPTGFDGTIVFNGFGAVAVSGTYTIDITHATAACAAASGPSGPIRCRRIVVSPVGRVSSCDPAAPAGDSRAC
jgi:type IV fimbrial biogenesis protein FimT